MKIIWNIYTFEEKTSYRELIISSWESHKVTLYLLCEMLYRKFHILMYIYVIGIFTLRVYSYTGWCSPPQKLDRPSVFWRKFHILSFFSKELDLNKKQKYLYLTYRSSAKIEIENFSFAPPSIFWWKFGKNFQIN